MRSDLHALWPERDVRTHHPDPGSVHVQAVCLVALDNLGIAGRDHHACRGRGLAHRRGDAPQVGNREPFLDDEAGGEQERSCTRDGQVVDGAVDRELADVAAGEKDRLDHVRVGREREPGAVQLDDRRVAERREEGVLELLEKEALDERPGRLAAGSVGEGDDLVPELGTALPHAGTRSCGLARRP
jgi:hypothetical protein